MSNSVENFQNWPGKWVTENSSLIAVQKNGESAFEIITIWSKEMITEEKAWRNERVARGRGQGVAPQTENFGVNFGINK